VWKRGERKEVEEEERRCGKCYEERRANVEWMRPNEKEGEKRTGRNTEGRWNG
jgi:hypothetical protein